MILCIMTACNDRLNIKRDYDFSLSSWYLPSDIQVGEEVEIRLTMLREGNYLPERYSIGYIQMEGDGEVHDVLGNKLITRESYPLDRIPGLNRDNPLRQVFTLWYKCLSDEAAKIKFVIEDSFGQQRELVVSFDATTVLK